MNVYINYNFCGYRWFGVEDISSIKGKIHLNDNIHYETHSALIGNLITYDPYDLVLLEDKHELILAIRGIEDTRQDTYNRKHLEIAMLLVGNRNDFELLHKVMLTYITHKKDFDAWLRGTLYSDVSDVIFDTQLFLNGLNKIQTASIMKFRGLGGLTYVSGLCFVCSNWGQEKITSLLGIEKRRITSAIEKMEQCSVSKWITNPFVEEDSTKEQLCILNNEIKRLKKRLVIFSIGAFIIGLIIGCLML